MRERLASGGEAKGAFPDPKTLLPLEVGRTYGNTLGETMLELPEVPVWVGSREVSVEAYELFIKETGREWPGRPSFLTNKEHPAAGVSWIDATAFCDWLTRFEKEAGLLPEGARYRLPTDLEWSEVAGLSGEIGADPAARSGGDKEHLPWPGSVWPPPRRAANLDATKIEGFDDRHSYTGPVADGDPNEAGYFELGGNVAEWCEDVWPGNEAERVVRGGSWLSFEREALLTSVRMHVAADSGRPNIGFRLALELPGG